MGWKDHIPSESLVMIGCQFTYAAMILVTKKGLSQGMSSLAFVVYRQFVAFLLLAPLAFFTRRLGTNACSMGWKNFWLICLLALVGFEPSLIDGDKCIGQFAARHHLRYGLYHRLEKLHLPSARSVAKIIGTVHEELYTGSFIGSLAVIMGLYIVLWGKAKDHEDVNGETGHDPTSYAEVSDNESCTVDLKEPLLPGK
ncbi:UNVERIFIED_CONTAM: WAT1-related protein [Sesamum calycinum]|uniref:WAT1-related protein n=1 Tax=Sesamum calycinum TaxID=2727403 RepID=A0AAW2JZP6_9LAMI